MTKEQTLAALGNQLDSSYTLQQVIEIVKNIEEVQESMTVEVKIPQEIINSCIGEGWGELQTKEHFNAYLGEVMYDLYGQFSENFSIWLLDEVVGNK